MSYKEMFVRDVAVVWLDFTKMNVCKSREKIHAYHLNNCSLPMEPLSEQERQDYCACYANHVADAWINTPQRKNSQNTIDINSAAMLECRKK